MRRWPRTGKRRRSREKPGNVVGRRRRRKERALRPRPIPGRGYGQRARRQKATWCATPCGRRDWDTESRPQSDDFQRVGSGAAHPGRRPARAEHRPSAAAASRSIVFPHFGRQLPVDLAHGIARHVRADGLRFGEIAAAPNGGKAAVLLRVCRGGAIERQPARGRPSGRNRHGLRRSPHETGEAAKAEDDPEFRRFPP